MPSFLGISKYNSLVHFHWNRLRQGHPCVPSKDELCLSSGPLCFYLVMRRCLGRSCLR
jgi:hypothetical protein